MRVKDLEKIRPLLATPKMMKMAAEDTLRVVKHQYWDEQVYNHGLYMRCHVHDGILKVAFFLTELMKTGGRLPMYELYISKDHSRFITFDCLHRKWMNSKLDNLDWPYYVSKSDNKWISRQDHDIIKKYLGGEAGGYADLLAYQLQIRHDELMVRHKKETDSWDEDLAAIAPLPKDWNHWVAKVGVRQNYIFYSYTKKGAVTGYCTFCEKEVPIKKPRYDQEKPCPRCRHMVKYKSVGKAGTVLTERYQMYLIQRFREGFVIRQFEGHRRYLSGEYAKPECTWHEIRRAIFGANANGLRAYYWGKYKNQYYRWNISNVCSSTWYGNQAGSVYGKTLPHLARRELKQTGLIETLKHNVPIDPEKYLAVLNAFPQLERFSKANLTRMVHQCLDSLYTFRGGLHNENASSLTKMLGINTQELKRLRMNNGGIGFLGWLRYENATGKILRDKDIKWLCSEKIVPKTIQFVRDRMSIVQICNYIRRQILANRCTSSEVITKWADYLSMAKRLKMDTNDEIIFRVNKLFQRHDELVDRCHEKDLAIQAGQILEDYPHVDEIYEAIKEKYGYSDDKYTVLVPTCIEDVLLEGRNLHHCAADSHRYWERIERRESFVLFLRRTSNVTKSYYTLEVEPNGTIRQKRTMYDRQNPDIEDAKAFLRKWQSEVSKRLTEEDKKLAEESRILRNESFTQLRNDQVIIHTGALAGQLLVNVLLADLMENACVTTDVAV